LDRVAALTAALPDAGEVPSLLDAEEAHAAARRPAARRQLAIRAEPLLII
jgi:hypothetical protein